MGGTSRTLPNLACTALIARFMSLDLESSADSHVRDEWVSPEGEEDISGDSDGDRI